MDDLDLDGLARDAAGALVQALLGGAGDAVVERFRAVLGAQAARLPEARRRLTGPGAGDAAVRDEEATWRVRLRDLLTDDPALASKLRELVSTPDTTATVTGPETVHTAYASGGSSVNQVSGTSGGRVEIDSSHGKRTFNIPIFGFIGKIVVGHPVASAAVAAVVAAGAVGTAAAVHTFSGTGGGKLTIRDGEMIDLSTKPPQTTRVLDNDDVSYYVNFAFGGESFNPLHHNLAEYTDAGSPTAATCKDLVNTKAAEALVPAKVGLTYCFITHTGSVGYFRVVDVTPQQVTVAITDLF